MTCYISQPRFDNYVSIYVMFAVGALECLGLPLGQHPDVNWDWDDDGAIEVHIRLDGYLHP